MELAKPLNGRIRLFVARLSRRTRIESRHCPGSSSKLRAFNSNYARHYPAYCGIKTRSVGARRLDTKEMKYFTLDWWRGDAECDFEQYHSYINSIRPQIAENLIEFMDNISLHDAHIIHFNLDMANGRLEFLLDAMFPSSGPADVEHHNPKLVYEEVSAFHSTSTPKKALGGPASYGELGYDEIELLGEQLFEHRLLFSSGIELQIQFKDIKWQRLD